MFWMLKRPSARTETPKRVPVGSWTATTLAPGSVAPVPSETEPLIADVVTTCAEAGAVASTLSVPTARRIARAEDLRIVDFGRVRKARTSGPDTSRKRIPPDLSGWCKSGAATVR